jgi:transposase InsO family protein
MRELEQVHQNNLGSGRMTMYLNRDYDWGQKLNKKRVRRLMAIEGIESDIRRSKVNRRQKEAQYLAENVLNQDFATTAPNQKWASDMTELTYGLNREYSLKLSAVPDS